MWHFPLIVLGDNMSWQWQEYPSDNSNMIVYPYFIGVKYDNMQRSVDLLREQLFSPLSTPT